MTEDEWRTGTDTRTMLWQVLRSPHRASDRKLRLFAVACVLRVEPLLADAASREALTVAEGYAEGIATRSALDRAFTLADGACREHGRLGNRAGSHAAAAARDVCRPAAKQAADLALYEASAAVAYVNRSDPNVQYDELRHYAELEHLAPILRDVIGNPFRAVAADLRWLTPTVTGLAEALYNKRAFDRVPVLADALEESGCDHPDILSHCRSDQQHVRGCWVVDLILGKS